MLFSISLNVTALYLGIFSIFYFLLSINVIRSRWKFAVSLGDGGNSRMASIMRAHGNFAEYVPFTMLMVAVLELAKSSPNVLHTICGFLLAGRLLHAYGLFTKKGVSFGRSVGMTLTFAAMMIAGISLLQVR